MSKQENAAIVIISILFALIVKTALEKSFGAVTQGDIWLEPKPIVVGQLLVFFVLFLRFYFGAIRYVETEPKNTKLAIRAINFLFAFFLFCVFYLVALAVAQPAFFYILIVLLHAIDALWFIVALVLSYVWYVRDADLQPGEVRIASSRRVMIAFLFLSLVTIVYGLFSYPLFHASITDKAATSAHWHFLFVLFALSAIDFLMLHSYYFSNDAWREKNCVPKTA